MSAFHPLSRALMPSALAAALLSFLLAVPGGAQVTVRVLDYNIHRDIGGSDSNTTAQPALAQVVNYLNPDIWTINELGGNNVAYNATTAHTALVAFIQTRLTIFGASPVEGVNFYTYLGTLTDGFITNAIVSRYPLIATQTYSDAGSGFSSLRGLVSATVDLPGTTTDLGVFTAHLKALSTTNDAEKRQTEAEANRASISGWLSGHTTVGAIVTGDWNETEETGETDNWSSGAIGGTLPNLGVAYHPITTMKAPGLSDPIALSIAGNRATIDSASPDARFDYTLFTPAKLTLVSALVFDTKQYTTAQLSSLNASNGTSFTAATSSTASDHLPVFTVLSVVPEPSLALLFGLGMGTLALHRRRVRP